MIISTASKERVYHREDCPYVKKIQKKYRQFVKLETAKKKGYCECSYCGGLHGVYLSTVECPDMFGEKIRRFISFDFDCKKRALLIRTSAGFWKLRREPKDQLNYLYHLNERFFDRQASSKKLARRQFHRQGDVEPSDDVSAILNYIYRHDKAKLASNGDYRKLPKKTKLQKKYYKQAKKKKRYKENKRLDEIFKQLENERRT